MWLFPLPIIFRRWCFVTEEIVGPCDRVTWQNRHRGGRGKTANKFCPKIQQSIIVTLIHVRNQFCPKNTPLSDGLWWFKWKQFRLNSCGASGKCYWERSQFTREPAWWHGGDFIGSSKSFLHKRCGILGDVELSVQEEREGGSECLTCQVKHVDVPSTNLFLTWSKSVW